MKTANFNGAPLELAANGRDMFALALPAAMMSFGALQTTGGYETLFDAAFEYDAQPYLWETSTASGGAAAHDASKRAMSLSVTSTPGSSVIRQQYGVNRYQPGKLQVWKNTFVSHAGTPGLRLRAGYFDAADGIFFQHLGATVSLVERTSVSGEVVETVVPQSAWNLDRLDGSGSDLNPSEILLDMTKQQISLGGLEWLGAGAVKVGFDIGGRIIFCHVFEHSNVSAVAPYMRTANLPLRMELTNVSAASGGSALQICAAVESVGGVSTPPGFPFAAALGAVSTSVTTRRPVLSIRPAAAFGGFVNRVHIVPETFDLLVGSANVFYELVYNPTLTGAAWAAVDATSAVEYDKTASALTGGLVVAAGYVAAGAGTTRAALLRAINSKLPLCLDAAGANPRTLTLACTSLSGAATVNASLSGVERR